MKKALRQIGTVLGWLYAGLITAWFVLHAWIGDAIWWLALLDSFTPFLFLPLILILPACLVCRWRAFQLSVVPPVLIFLALYGALFLPQLTPASGEDPLVIMTFNVWGYSGSAETAQAIIHDEVPDIVAVQELSPQMGEVLLAELGAIYPYRSVSFGAERESGMAVLSRYPLAVSGSERLSGWRVQVMEVSIGERTVTLYNIHPEVSNVLAYVEEGDSLPQTVEASWAEREAQVRELVADIEGRGGPVILAGDLNSTDQSTAYRLLREVLVDAHRAAGWGFGHTFPAYEGSWRGIPIVARQMRIDMVFYSQDFAALSCRVGSAHGESDHLPVVAELVWRE
jgi:vancomycin resistance protein VanJ